jgi:hypothetical protein
VPAARSVPQEVGFGTGSVWLRGTGLGLREGDALLLVGEERERFARTPGHVRGRAIQNRDDERWDFRIVSAVAEEPDDLEGWTRLDLERRVGFAPELPLTAAQPKLLLFQARGSLFGASAPHPGLMPADVGDAGRTDWTGIELPWPGTDPKDPSATIEVEGDQPGIVPGSWILLERDNYRELYMVRLPSR